MTSARISLFVASLVLATTVAASAAVTVRTNPVTGLGTGGRASCAAVNGGTAEVLVTTTLFGHESGLSLATESFAIPPKSARFGTQVPTNGNNPINTNPSWCECVVPDQAKVRCSFIHVDGAHVTVLPAE